MKLVDNKHISCHLNNPFFQREEFVFLFKEIINESFFTRDTRQSGELNWAFDLRRIFTQSKYTKKIFPVLAIYLNKLGYSNFAVRGFGAFPFIGLINYQNIDSYLLVRNERKKYAFKEHIEGEPLCKSKRLIILEDLINTGGSVQRTKDILNESGYKPDSVFSFINFNDREKVCKNLKIYSAIELYKK